MRILVQGAGSIGQRHYRNILVLGHEPAFLRTSKERRPFVQKFYEEQESLGRTVLEFQHIEDACNEWGPDALIVATPNHLHLEAARAGAAHGLHLLIEKPIHNQLEEVDTLEHEVLERGLVTLVGYNLRFHPLLQKAHALVTSQTLGTILSASIEVGESIEDWHPWEDYRDTYAPYVASGGGALLCFSHDIDYAYWLLGMPRAVMSAGGKITPLAGDAEDLVQSLWVYEDGKTAQLHIDYFQRPKVRTLKVIGSLGTVVWDAYGVLMHTEHLSGVATTYELPDGFERNDMFIAELTHFIECIQGKATSLIPLSEGRAVLELVERMKENTL